MGSKADEVAAANLAFGNISLAEAIEMLRTQRQIANVMGEIIRRPTIPDTASVLPNKPGPTEQPKASTGWAKDNPLEMPLGETGQRIIEDMCNHMLGPSVPVKPKRK